MKTLERRFVLLCAVSIGVARAADAQSGTFVPGGRELFAINFASTPIGTFPAEIKLLHGKAQVVDKDGAHMLRASEPSEILVNLHENLPDAFTVEFDLVPKACCNPEDLTFEGTPAISRSAASAHIVWHPQTLIVVGGGAYFQIAMPQDLMEALPSNLTHVNASVDGRTIKLYTNGRLLYTLQDRGFIRGRVLRVSLGGQDEKDYAVYLARLRIAAGGSVVAEGAPQSGPRSVTTTSGVPTAPTAPVAATLDTVKSGFTVTVTSSAAGPVVSWTILARATGYSVIRSKMDDVNCCNTSSGGTPLASGPWQDKPLPMSGTYLYRVIANTAAGPIIGETQFGFRMPGGGTIATVDPVLVQAPTGTITPIRVDTTTRVTERAPTGTAPTILSNGPAPASVRVFGIPTVAHLDWDAVPGATYYNINRALAGTTTWTPLVTGANLVGVSVNVSIPDAAQTYTYQVVAYQPDGRYGAASANFKPTIVEPRNFTATALGPGQVRFDWDNIKAQFDPMFRDDVRSTYLLAGPGTGTGITVVGSSTSVTERNTYTLTGIPSGTQTWTLTVVWQPGGVLSPSTSWTKATATVPAVVADPAPRYRLVVLGFRAVQQSKDIDDTHDGHGDEVYFSAIVNRTQLTGIPLPVTKGANMSMVLTRSYGDEAVSVPYGRVKAGTASSTGGIQSGDLVPANLDLSAPTGALQEARFPLSIWEGELPDTVAVVVHPALWEDDVNPIVQATWAKAIFDAAPTGYLNEPPQYDGYISSGYVSHATADVIYRLSDMNHVGLFGHRTETITNAYNGDLDPPGNDLFPCTVWAVNATRRPCEAHGVDRPLGLLARYGDPSAPWRERIILLTRAGVEKSLAGNTYPDWKPGTFVLKLKDIDGTKGSVLDTDLETIASYELYLRIERLP